MRPPEDVGHGLPLDAEEDVLPFGRLLGILIATLLLAAGLCVWAWGVLYVHEGHLRPGRHFPERHLGPPEARQGVEEVIFDLQRKGPALERAQRHELDRFRWVDQQQRIVQIPIERAIDVIAGGEVGRR